MPKKRSKKGSKKGGQKPAQAEAAKAAPTPAAVEPKVVAVDTLFPQIEWAETERAVFITIKVSDCETANPVIAVTDDNVSFNCKTAAGHYACELKLKAAILPADEETVQSVTGRNVQFHLVKKDEERWNRLLADKSFRKGMIRPDFDKWVDSDDEDKDQAGFDTQGMGGMGGGGGMPGMGGMGGMPGMGGMGGMPGMGGMGGMPGMGGGAGGQPDMAAMMEMMKGMGGGAGGAGGMGGMADLMKGMGGMGGEDPADEDDEDDDDLPDLEDAEDA